ncbi:poly(A)-specific ribonuclease PNLDC1 isoform X3 [Zonotrichia leucophrys gambelii]|uniref:poly(A)-specific ribonuclease PNLDC1 isoform X3 n=1 Tax=Zonotrichia leucophrys gambelii TaxID=257770 RepID=UPI00313FF328
MGPAPRGSDGHAGAPAGPGCGREAMEVGAEGFAQHLPRLRRRILRAAFMALDVEFTGLHSTSVQNNEPSLFDSPAERYGKARHSVQRFTLVQLGLAIFSKENSNKYVVHSYNFFLFPSTLGIKDVEFTLSASSIQFLSHYGFDYNKFLKDGIPYMNEVQEKILRQHLLAGTWKVCSTNNADRDVLKKAIAEVTTWIGAAKEEDTMVLQDLSGYHMIEVQLVLRQALENVWTEPLGDKKVMVKKVSPEHRQLLENSSYDRCQKKLILLSARGFTNLFQILVKVKKPLVGHNMLMDLMHLHDKFYRPLPESYEEFKRNIHNLFPVIIDTKTVTKSMQKKCLFPRVSSLVEAYAVLCRSTDGAAEAEPSFSQYLAVLAEHVNKVNFIRGGVSSINFSGEDSPCRHPPALVVHVRGWPGLTEGQIYQEFKARCCFDVRRLSKNQFILLSNKYKQVRHVLRDYRHHPHLQVSVYRHWRHSPSVNCLLQISGIVALWSLLAFMLGGTRSC